LSRAPSRQGDITEVIVQARRIRAVINDVGLGGRERLAKRQGLAGRPFRLSRPPARELGRPAATRGPGQAAAGVRDIPPPAREGGREPGGATMVRLGFLGPTLSSEEYPQVVDDLCQALSGVEDVGRPGDEPFEDLHGLTVSRLGLGVPADPATATALIAQGV